MTVAAAFAVYPDPEAAPLTVLGETSSPTVPVDVPSANRAAPVTENPTFRMFLLEKCLSFFAV